MITPLSSAVILEAEKRKKIRDGNYNTDRSLNEKKLNDTYKTKKFPILSMIIITILSFIVFAFFNSKPKEIITITPNEIAYEITNFSDNDDDIVYNNYKPYSYDEYKKCGNE